VYNSTYAFSENKVIRHIELEGLEALDSQDPRFRALMNDRVQQKMQTASNTLKSTGAVELSAGPGVGLKVNGGPVTLNAGVNGPQVKHAVNMGGESKTEGTLAGAGIKINTPIGNGGVGGSVGNVKIENGKLETNAIQGGASVEPSVSKKTKDGSTSAKINVSSNAEVGVGGQFGIVGIFVKLNPVNLIIGAAQTLDAIITYKIESSKENSGNPIINRNVNHGPKN
jgi:hypothetical protein